MLAELDGLLAQSPAGGSERAVQRPTTAPVLARERIERSWPASASSCSSTRTRRCCAGLPDTESGSDQDANGE